MTVDKIIETLRKIQLNKIGVLTGENGSGKSLIRKLMPNCVHKESGLDINYCVAQFSMEKRMEHRFDGLTGRDLEWIPTSINTYGMIKSLLEVSSRFIIIDEPEIGLSRESQAGICQYINSRKDEICDIKNIGLLIITHSEYIVRNIDKDYFLNLQDLDENSWINREIKPVDFYSLEKSSRELFQEIQKRIENGKHKQK